MKAGVNSDMIVRNARIAGFRRVGKPIVGTLHDIAGAPRADWVIDILPAAADTAAFFDGVRFAAMKPGAIFINIGRGATVDQSALLAALHGHLRAAYLDVTTPEPLPPEHPLWSAPNCTITPHFKFVQTFLQPILAAGGSEP